MYSKVFVAQGGDDRYAGMWSLFMRLHIGGLDNIHPTYVHAYTSAVSRLRQAGHQWTWAQCGANETPASNETPESDETPCKQPYSVVVVARLLKGLRAGAGDGADGRGGPRAPTWSA